jgi:hypothetical protein
MLDATRMEEWRSYTRAIRREQAERRGERRAWCAETGCTNRRGWHRKLYCDEHAENPSPERIERKRRKAAAARAAWVAANRERKRELDRRAARAYRARNESTPNRCEHPGCQRPKRRARGARLCTVCFALPKRLRRRMAKQGRGLA